MDFRVVSYLLGRLSVACGIVLSVPFGMAVLYKEENINAFGWAVIVCLLAGTILKYFGKTNVHTLTVREGMAVTVLGWVMATFLGMIPYAAGGYLSVLDSVVETVSGFSGTGATVIDDIEALPQSLLLWRSLTHWFGGLVTEGFSGCQMSSSVRAGAVHVIALNQRCMKFISDRLQESRIDHFGAVTLISEYNLQTDFALYGQSDGFEYV